MVHSVVVLVLLVTTPTIIATIGESTFEDSTRLTSISIPTTITSIVVMLLENVQVLLVSISMVISL